MIRDLIRPKEQEAQNFAAQVPVQKTERTSGFYLSLALDVLTVVFAFWLGLAYRNFLESGGAFRDVMLVAIALETSLALGLYLTKNIGRRILVLAAVTVGLFFFILTPLTISFAGVGVLISFLCFVWGEALGRARVANALNIRFLHGVQPLLANTTTALIVSGLLLFVPSWSAARALPAPSTFETYFQAVGGVLRRFYSEIDLSGSFEKFATGVARYQLLKTQDFRKLPPARQAEMTRETVFSVSANFAKAIGVEVPQANEPMGRIFYKVLVRILVDLQDQFGPWLLVLWAAMIFTVLRGGGVVLHWFAGLLAYLLFHALMVMGAIRTRGETQTQEVVEYI